MKIIIGGRQNGKTMELIKMSAETGFPIVVRSVAEVERIRSIVKKMGFKIPYPITAEKMMAGRIFDKSVQVLVDNAESVLSDILMAKVEAAAINADEVDIKGITPLARGEDEFYSESMIGRIKECQRGNNMDKFICDDCIKKDVCSLKENCNMLERDLDRPKLNDAFTLTVKCKHRKAPDIYNDPTTPTWSTGPATCKSASFVDGKEGAVE